VDADDLLDTGAKPVALVLTAFVVGSAVLLVLVGVLFGA
jgi:multisubunit Na+/H+ antiporter MnhC subunit